MNRNDKIALGLALFALAAGAPLVAFPADLRVVDSAGLVRGVKVVQEEGDIEVLFPDGAPIGTECTLKNVDGLAPDKTVLVAQNNACRFSTIPAGTWQVSVSKVSKWQVKITGAKG